jgi:hypothetical protein
MMDPLPAPATGFSPLTYPQELQRKHAPRGYADFGAYKPWLRDEFAFRCVFCLCREAWYPSGADNFAVEHLVPKSVDVAKTNVYENLLYACARCNSAKGTRTGFPDPANTAFAALFEVGQDGTLTGSDATARWVIDTLGLNSKSHRELRKHTLRIVAMKRLFPDDEFVDHLFRWTFRYPDDMVDLRKSRPPEGNDMPDGAVTCHVARRERGELPEVY